MARALEMWVCCLIGALGCGPPATGLEAGDAATGDTGTDTGEAECGPPLAWDGEALEVDANVHDTLRGADGLAVFSNSNEATPAIVLERGPEDWQSAGELPYLLEGVLRQPFEVSDGQVLALYANIEDLVGENTGPPGEYFVHARDQNGSWPAIPLTAGDVEFGSVGGIIDGDRVALPGAGHTGTVGTFLRGDDGVWTLDELLEFDGDVARLSLSGDRLLVVLTDRNELFEHDGVAWQPLEPLAPPVMGEGFAQLTADGARVHVLTGQRLDIYALEGDRPLVQTLEGPPVPAGDNPSSWWKWTSDWIIHFATGGGGEPVTLTVFRQGVDELWSLHAEAVLDRHGDSALVGDELLVHEFDAIRRYSLCAP